MGYMVWDGVNDLGIVIMISGGMAHHGAISGGGIFLYPMWPTRLSNKATKLQGRRNDVATHILDGWMVQRGVVRYGPTHFVGA